MVGQTTNHTDGIKRVYTPTRSIAQSDKGLRPKTLRRNGEPLSINGQQLVSLTLGGR